jgi:hypothetical protein
MFFHQFRDDLVLALELVPQRRDGPQMRLLCVAKVIDARSTIPEQPC